MTTDSPNQRLSGWLDAFDAALQANDSARVAELFAPDCYWRDFVSFTWNLKTMEGRDAIRDMVDATIEDIGPSHWALVGDATEADGITEGWISFETKTGRGEGHLRLNAEGAWTLLTTLRELKGFEERKGTTRIKGVDHGADRERVTWLEKKQQDEGALGYSEQPYCVVIGGGQGGIGLGARLRRLGVPTLIIEKNARVV
ncbi:MAG: nuclear transport factor 2 family protein [Pseudomonadota bacterium]